MQKSCEICEKARYEDCLKFYDNLRLPSSVEYTQAFLNTFKFSNEKHKNKICEHFKIQIPATIRDASSFMFDVMSYNYNHESNKNDRYSVYWKFFIEQFNSVIADNLKQNYCNLKYGKAFFWQIFKEEKHFKIDSFLKEFGLENNKDISKLILWQEIKAECKGLLEIMIFFAFISLVYSLLC